MKRTAKFFFKRPALYALIMIRGEKSIGKALQLVGFLEWFFWGKIGLPFPSRHGGLRVSHRQTDTLTGVLRTNRLTDGRVVIKAHRSSMELDVLSAVIVTIITNIIMYCVLWKRQLQSDSSSSAFHRKVLYYLLKTARLAPLCYAVHLLSRTLLSYYTCCSLSFTYTIPRLSS